MAPKLSKPLSAGEVVVEDKPLIHFITNEFKDKFCNNCLKRSDELKKCSKCRQMFYCDRSCQRVDWIHHKNECQVFGHKNFNSMMSSFPEGFLLRLWLHIKSDETFATKRHQLFNGSDVCLNDLKVDVKDISNVFKFVFDMICNNFEAYGLVFDRKELLQWFGFISINSSVRPLIAPQFGSQLFSEKQIGSAIYIQFTTLSHSCVPNCALIHNGPTIELRAMKYIPIGTEVTINSVILTANKTERHRLLKQLSIDCKCIKCERNTDSGVDYSLFERTDQLMSRYVIEYDLKVVNKLLKIFPKLMTICDKVFGDYYPKKTTFLFMYLFVLIRTQCEDKSLVSKVKSDLFRALSVTHPKDHGLRELFDKISA